MSQTEFRKALVTGGAGFIGSHLAERLCAEGVETTVLDDLSVGRRENVPRGARFVEGSILDDRAVDDALDGVEVVFHNAARVSIRNSFDDVMSDTETNVLGTVNLLRRSGRAVIKRFIYASSMAVYGTDAALPLKESSVLEPISPYGTGKLAGELYGRQLGAFYGFDACALRYFNTFGPRQTFTPYVGVITIFTQRLLAGKPAVIFGTGDQVRDFVHVSDIVEANMRAARQMAHGSVVNVGTGKGRSVGEIATMLREKIYPSCMPVYADPPDGEPGSSIADTEQIKRQLGFVPDVRLEDAIDEVIEWNAATAGV